MSTAPTGDFACPNCGAWNGHHTHCPMIAWPLRQAFEAPQPDYGAKIDRIIELLEAIARANGHGWQGGPR
jgi:hypothetical protein